MVDSEVASKLAPRVAVDAPVVHAPMAGVHGDGDGAPSLEERLHKRMQLVGGEHLVAGDANRRLLEDALPAHWCGSRARLVGPLEGHRDAAVLLDHFVYQLHGGA